MSRMSIFAVLVLAGTMGLAAEGDDPSDKRKPANSLDEELLRGLDNDLLEGLGDIPLKPALPSPDGDQSKSPPANEPSRDVVDEPAPSVDPLTRTAQQMQTVKALIDAKNTSRETQDLQKKIVDQLAALIQEAQKKCSSGQCDTPPRDGQPKDNPGAPASPKSTQAARDSTQRLGNADAQTTVAEAETADELFKQAWGHLPERVRRQMQNVTVERFLPKYEELIEQYYKRLAAQGQNQP